jgi:hypothetical protein
MNFLSIKGTSNSYFQIKKNGPKIHNISNVFAFKDNTGSFYAPCEMAEARLVDGLITLNSQATESGEDWIYRISRPVNGMTANLLMHFPPVDGTNGQVVQTDGSGNWSFKTVDDLTNKYGSMYANNIFQPVIIGAIDTYYQIPGNLSDGGSVAFSFQNSKELLCAAAGIYLVNWSCALNCDTPQNLSAAIIKNTAAQLNTVGHSYNSITGGISHLSGTGILSLSINDLIGLAVANNSNTSSIFVSHMNLTLIKIAEAVS